MSYFWLSGAVSFSALPIKGRVEAPKIPARQLLPPFRRSLAQGWRSYRFPSGHMLWGLASTRMVTQGIVL